MTKARPPASTRFAAPSSVDSTEGPDGQDEGCRGDARREDRDAEQDGRASLGRDRGNAATTDHARLPAMATDTAAGVPLSEPARAELRLEQVLAALSDPLRLHMVQRLLLDSPDTDRSCGWFGIDRPKYTLTHHFRVLREAGGTHRRQYGLERRSRVRIADLDARFPGLLDLVRTWKPAE